jgi:hypothetical protein
MYLMSKREGSSLKHEEVVTCWVPEDKGAVHVKVIALPHNDPVELTAESAKNLGLRLLALAAEVE